MNIKLYTYPYLTDYTPAMPVIEVGLSMIGESTATTWTVAIIDSGADGTLIPITTLEKANARYIDKARMRGVLGYSQIVDMYIVTLYIDGHQLPGIRVAALGTGSEAVLGRNVLNHLTLTLNGPTHTTEIPY